MIIIFLSDELTYGKRRDINVCLRLMDLLYLPKVIKNKLKSALYTMIP